nr:hypothetical protein CFP56_55087 [Quercus suber]
MDVLRIVKCLGLSWDIGVSIFRDFCIRGNNGVKGCEDKEFIKGVLIFVTRDTLKTQRFRKIDAINGGYFVAASYVRCNFHFEI